MAREARGAPACVNDPRLELAAMQERTNSRVPDDELRSATGDGAEQPAAQPQTEAAGHIIM